MTDRTEATGSVGMGGQVCGGREGGPGDTPSSSDSWKTKPTDRFVLRWIKCCLSARITPRLVGVFWVKPWMITLCASGLGLMGGAAFALGWGWGAGLLALGSQIFDGVDGQYARLIGKQSKGGAFLDSVLDRYADGALVIGMSVYLYDLAACPLPRWAILVLGALAVIGSSLISYSSARAAELGIHLGGATLASKGTRTTVVAMGGIGSVVSPWLPALALVYLVIHPNGVMVFRLLRVHRDHPPAGPAGP